MRLLQVFLRPGLIWTLILLSTIYPASSWTQTTPLSRTDPGKDLDTDSASYDLPGKLLDSDDPAYSHDPGRKLEKMSVLRCCVPNCNKTRADNTILHVFPNPDKDLNRFNTWRNAIGGDILQLDQNTVFGCRRVCHVHFEPQYHTRSKRLSPDAVPTLLLSEASIATMRPPFQDITHRVLNEPGTSQSVSDLQSNQHVGAQEQPPVPSTSKGESQKRQLKSFMPDIHALGEKIKKLQKAKITAMANLKKALTLSQNVTFQKTLKKFTAVAVLFTMLQFREAGKPKTGRRFKKEEKVMSLALYKQGPRAYRWLRRFFTLPSPLTLSKMIQTAALKPGINENLFKQLKKKAQKMTDNDKLCILLFDEIALTPHFDYNRRSDGISGFVNNGTQIKKGIADHALVFMLRGLHKNYKQPLSYTFCAGTTQRNDLILQIKAMIRKINSTGFKCVATVCDQGATNVSAINYLVNETKSIYLKNNKEWRNNIFEVDGEEIIPLYDPPHLIKGIRNNLLNKDLNCVINGKVKTGKWEHILQLYNKDPAYQGLKLVPKLTEKHVIPHKIAKMKVKCATQIFSRTVAVNMGYLASVGILPKECEETADVLLFFDSLFDSMNGSYVKAQKKTSKPLLGPATPKSAHKKEWTEAVKVLKTMKFKKNNRLSIVPSISHWIETLENMQYLLESLSKKYGLTSVWMRHFNQDPLENFFGSIRSHGYRNTSPSCAGFEAAFAALLINNLSGAHSPGSNCEKDSCSVFKSLKALFFQNQDLSSNIAVEVDFEDITECNVDNFENKNLHPKIRAQLEYVTGYVLRNLKRKVFKNCKACSTCLYSNDKEQNYLTVREHIRNKRCLTYPKFDLVKCFSMIQDTVIYIIRKDCTKLYIKLYIKTILATNVNYDFIKCNKHRNDLILKLEEICVNFFLCNWCKDVNRLLKGTRTDYDNDDVMQKLAIDYFKKRLKSTK